VDARVRRVRSFNRRVTQRVGALQDDYLSRRRSLGASRVLWEIEPAGTDVRTVRARLHVDSGYLSRLLRTLEAEGLVRVRTSSEDQRVRVVRLTAAGRAERAELDRLSDDLAGSLLEALDEPHRDRLVEAMATVERLLTVGLVEIGDEDPTSNDAQHCLGAYFRELDERFEGGFDAGRSIPADASDLVEPAGLLLVARLDGRPVGAGAV
jgi:DNA-binding MarR family transcriptional regulator